MITNKLLPITHRPLMKKNHSYLVTPTVLYAISKQSNTSRQFPIVQESLNSANALKMDIQEITQNYVLNRL